MKILFAVTAGIIVGFVLGWLLSPGSFRYFYRTTRDIELLDDNGVVVGRLPRGTPVISDYKLSRSVDLGWWAYAPVQFNTMQSAYDLGIQPGSKVKTIGEFTLRASDGIASSTDATVSKPSGDR